GTASRRRATQAIGGRRGGSDCDVSVHRDPPKTAGSVTLPTWRRPANSVPLGMSPLPLPRRGRAPSGSGGSGLRACPLDNGRYELAAPIRNWSRFLAPLIQSGGLPP